MKVLGNVELLKKIYDKLLTDVAKKYDLNSIELKILIFLDKNESNVSKDIVEGISATKSHVSMAVCDLEQKGYIGKLQDLTDKKKSHLQLTEKSFEVIQAGKEVQKNMKEIMLEGISQEELDVLSNISKKIQENLKKYGN